MVLNLPPPPPQLPHRISDSDSESPASASASRGGLLDHVEIISVDSSDDEDGPLVAPFEVLVKREATPAGSSAELHASSTPALIDLCSASDDDYDDISDGHSACIGSDNGSSDTAVRRTKKLRTSGGDRQRVRALPSHRSGASKHGQDSSHSSSSSSRHHTTIIRFKRRKMRHSEEQAGVYSSGDSSTRIGGPDAAAAGDSDTAYSTESLSDDDGDDVPSDDADHDADHDDDDAGWYTSASSELTREQVRELILRDVRALEAHKPWRFVYRCLDVPFQTDRATDAFDVLFERWDAFWRQWGRAVWERYFWAPLPVGSPEYHRRKYRQWRAARTFRTLATDLCERLGPDFLEPLTRRAHDGWWYRSAPLVLRELFQLDQRKYAMYMTLHRERFPRGSRFERSLAADWCLDDALRESSTRERGNAVYKAWQDVASSDDE